MANPILLKYNATTGVVPLAGALTVRELATNTADGRLFTKTDAGAVVEFARKDAVWHSDNDGAGSGLDADLLDGSHRDTAHNSFGNGTIPVRHSSGYLYSNYFNCTANVTATAPSNVAVMTGTDNFIRWQTWAQFKINLGYTAADVGLGNVTNESKATMFASPFFSGKAIVTAAGGILPASTGIAAASGGSGAFEAQAQGTGATAGAAFMTFHRPGAHAAHIGLDTDNFWKVGGWSMGAVAYKLWHEGSDGAGSGLDADLLDGQQGSFYQNASNLTSGSLPANVVPSNLYSSGSTNGSYTSNGIYYGSAAWRHLGTNSYGYVLRNSGVSGAQLYVASTAGTLDSVASLVTFTFRPNGNIAANGFESSVATGTAPLTVASTTKVTNLNADLIDGIDSTALVYGSANNGSNNAPATWSGSHISQYKSGFFDVANATWMPNTGWWWGINTAHTSNSASYLYGGQIIFENAATPRVFVRVTNGGATPGATAWQQVLTATQGTYSGALNSSQVTNALGFVPANSSGASSFPHFLLQGII